MAWTFFGFIFVLTCAVVSGAVYVKSWDADGRLTMDDSGLSDLDRFHLISRWGAHR
jgi:hypothetical protein